jgi:hypothetical protein
MDAQSHTEEVVVRATTMEAKSAEPATRGAVDFAELLDLRDLEAALRDSDFASLDLEESVRAALAEIAGAPDAGRDATHEGAKPIVEATAAVSEGGPGESPGAAELELAVASSDIAPSDLEKSSAATPVEALGADNDAAGAPREIFLAATTAEDTAAAGESLETVEFELALQNQNLVSLGFEESIRTALEGVGGEVLFQMRLEEQDCQRVAAVRIGKGDDQEFALVIMPPGGGIMRVESVSQSTNPLAMIAESYAGLVDVFRAAA